MKRYIFAAFILFAGVIITISLAISTKNYLWKTVIFGTAGMMAGGMVGMILDTVKIRKKPKQFKIRF